MRIIYLIASFILTANIAFAQVAAKDQVYTIDDFSKGLSTKTSSLSIAKGASVVSENVRLDTEHGSLTKRNQMLLYGTADATEPITGMYRLYLKDGTKKLIVSHGDEIEAGTDSSGTFSKILDLVTSDYRWQFLTWHDTLIGGDGYCQPIKYDGSSASATYLGTCLATDAGTGAGPNGTYSYKVSFYTATYEVVLSVASNSITVVDNDITLSMIPIAPDTYLGEDVVGRKVYRNKTGGGVWYLLSNGTIVDNTTVTLNDSDTDGELTVTGYPTVDYSTVYSGAPPRGKFYIVHNNRLWIANNPSFPSRVYYSEDGSPDFFEPDAYYNIRQDDGDQITFMKQVLGILTISKENSIQKLYTDGDDPAEDWSISDPFSFVGCKAPYSTVNTPEGVYYLDYTGIYKFNGQYSILMSDAITPTIKDILESNFSYCWGEYHKNQYYLSYPSKETGVSTNNRVLVYNIISKSFTIDIMNVNAFCTFSSGSDWDVLYSGASDSGKVYSHSGAEYEIRHNKHSDFTGLWEGMRYTPTGTPGGDANSPVIELAWTEYIDQVPLPIGSYSTSDIQIPQSASCSTAYARGQYTSQVLDIGASAFDKLYWNERLNTYGEINFHLRSADISASCPTATLSGAYTTPTGSDISSETAHRYVQYIASFSTTNLDYSPTIYKDNNYNVRLTYFKEAATVESSIPIKWQSGWVHIAPGYKVTLTKLDMYYESERSGTIRVTFTNWDGDTNTFDINLSLYPSHYTEYFTGGAFLADTFNIKITEDSLNSIRIKRLSCVYNIEPIY